MDEKKGKGEEPRPQRMITDREKLYLSVGDILMILTILVDLLYLSDVIQLAGNDLLALNVLVVSISFVVYQLKKRVRKRAARELAEKKKAEEA
ncbi:MAG: hypothetical protein ABIJ47_07820 [Candidatus Bathyarchaeota archaeon]